MKNYKLKKKRKNRSRKAILRALLTWKPKCLKYPRIHLIFRLSKQRLRK